jgi:hypothetical protein
MLGTGQNIHLRGQGIALKTRPGSHLCHQVGIFTIRFRFGPVFISATTGQSGRWPPS